MNRLDGKALGWRLTGLHVVSLALSIGWGSVQAAQEIEPDATVKVLRQNTDPLPLVLRYQVSGDQTATETGLGLRVHFDSRYLSVNSVSRELSRAVGLPNGGSMNDLMSSLGIAIDDTQDLDNDPDTDKMLVMGWADYTGNWPNQALPTYIVSVNFTASGNAFGNTQVRMTSSSVSLKNPNPGFVSTAATVCVESATGNECAGVVLPGDANGDGRISTNDVIVALNAFFYDVGVGSGADCNQSGGAISTNDIICILNLLGNP